MKPAPFPPPRCLAIDVDGVLLVRGQIDQRVVEHARLRISEGWDVYVWSSRGRAHAERACKMAGLDVPAISKPGYILDDKGWGWTRYACALPMSVLSD